MDFFYDIECPPGKKSVNGACEDIDDQQAEHLEGYRADGDGNGRPCKSGMYTSGTDITTHAEKQCLDCPDLYACNAFPAQSICWGQGQPWSNYEQVF